MSKKTSPSGAPTWPKCSLQQVHRENFEKLLPDVLAAIDQSAFVTVDTELTGLQASRHGKYNSFDDLATRYAKVRESATNFGLLQVGIGCFRPLFRNDGDKDADNSTPKWTAQCFSFYIFPGGIIGTNSAQSERRFMVQSSALNFLASHGYDFNKSFLKGIPYLNGWEEQRVRHGLLDRDTKKSKHDVIEIKAEADVAFVGETFAIIDKWLAEEQGDTLDLAPCNGYQRLLVYQQCELRFGETVRVSKKQADNRTWLQLKRIIPGVSAMDDEAEDMEQRKKQLEHNLGFRKVWTHMSKAKVPIVGHNCFLDLLHLWNKFEDGHLPTELVDFKRNLHALLPTIFDTKHMAISLCQLSMSLGELYEYFYDESDKQEDSKRKEMNARHILHGPLKQAKLHDAGYDAYCTGAVFLGVLSASNLLSSMHLHRDERVRNRLHIMQSPYECLNVACDVDVEPDWSCIGVLVEVSTPADPFTFAGVAADETPASKGNRSREVKELIAALGWSVSAYTRNTDHSFFLTFATNGDLSKAIGHHEIRLKDDKEEKICTMQLMSLDEYRRLFPIQLIDHSDPRPRKRHSQETDSTTEPKRSSPQSRAQ